MRLHTQSFKVNDTVVYVDLWQWRMDLVKVTLSVRYAIGEEKHSVSHSVDCPGKITQRSQYKAYMKKATAVEHENTLIRNAQKALKEIL